MPGVSSGVHKGAPVSKKELEPGGLVLSHDAKVISQLDVLAPIAKALTYAITHLSVCVLILSQRVIRRDVSSLMQKCRHERRCSLTNEGFCT